MLALTLASIGHGNSAPQDSAFDPVDAGVALDGGYDGSTLDAAPPTDAAMVETGLRPDAPAVEVERVAAPRRPDLPSYLHGVAEAGIGYRFIAQEPQLVDPTLGYGAELSWTFGFDVDVADRVRVGGVASYREASGHPSKLGKRTGWWEVGVRGSYLLEPGLRATLGLGTFVCEPCRDVDAHAYADARIEYRGIALFVDARVIAFDAFQQVRPLGSDVRFALGASATGRKGAAVVVAIELVVGLVVFASEMSKNDG